MKSPRYIVLNKKVGQTPLEAIGAWRAQNPSFADIPATYAGRLDPMASGKLLILLGDECKKREEYTGLDKEYEIQVVLGVSTDTGDALGLPLIADPVMNPDAALIHKAIRNVSGTHTVPYPAFSSKTVSGKPLFLHALEGTLSDISIPTHKETVYKIQLLEVKSVPASELHARIQGHLTHVPRSDEPSKVLGADFRQDEIRAQWKQLFSEANTTMFNVPTLRVTCASGTYMRTLAERLGMELGTKGFALSIHRSRIGKFVSIGPVRFWNKEY